METGARYTLNHLGDIVVGGLEKLWGSLKESTSGPLRRYTIYDLTRKRQDLITLIGERVLEIQGTSSELDILNDEILSNLFRELSQIEESIRENTPEKKEEGEKHNMDKGCAG